MGYRAQGGTVRKLIRTGIAYVKVLLSSLMPSKFKVSR